MTWYDKQNKTEPEKLDDICNSLYLIANRKKKEFILKSQPDLNTWGQPLCGHYTGFSYQNSFLYASRETLSTKQSFLQEYLFDEVNHHNPV